MHASVHLGVVLLRLCTYARKYCPEVSIEVDVPCESRLSEKLKGDSSLLGASGSAQ